MQIKIKSDIIARWFLKSNIHLAFFSGWTKAVREDLENNLPLENGKVILMKMNKSLYYNLLATKLVK